MLQTFRLSCFCIALIISTATTASEEANFYFCTSDHFDNDMYQQAASFKLYRGTKHSGSTGLTPKELEIKQCVRSSKSGSFYLFAGLEEEGFYSTLNTSTIAHSEKNGFIEFYKIDFLAALNSITNTAEQLNFIDMVNTSYSVYANKLGSNNISDARVYVFQQGNRFYSSKLKLSEVRE
jgi:hypothetical protein